MGRQSRCACAATGLGSCARVPPPPQCARGSPPPDIHTAERSSSSSGGGATRILVRGATSRHPGKARFYSVSHTRTRSFSRSPAAAAVWVGRWAQVVLIESCSQVPEQLFITSDRRKLECRSRVAAGESLFCALDETATTSTTTTTKHKHTAGCSPLRWETTYWIREREDAFKVRWEA